MHRLIGERWIHWLSIALLICWGLAATAYLFHDLEASPQFDMQVTRFALDLNAAIDSGNLGDYLLEVRKYPLLYSLPLAGAYRIAGLRAPHDNFPLFFGLGRVYTLLCAIGAAGVLALIGRRLFGEGKGVLALLCMNLYFFLFATAARPHIPVALWTLLALLWGLRMRERRTTSNVIGAFAFATVAACTLQNGFAAFVFPLWFFLAPKITARRIAAAAGIMAACLLAVALLGYPFVLAGLFGKTAAVGADLGHGVGLRFAFSHGVAVLLRLIQSEPLLFGLFIAALLPWMRKGDANTAFFPLLAYIGLYAAVFLFHVDTDGRYFIVMLLAMLLVAYPAFARMPSWARIALTGFYCIVFLRLAFLATAQNTFQQTFHAFDGALPPGTVVFVGDFPAEFFGFPQSELAESLEKSAYAIAPDGVAKSQGVEWTACKRIAASPTSDEIILLWNDASWQLYRVFEARALGTNTSIFCKEGNW